MPPTEPYDVCLILEGTYPYVSGGVSTWVHNLIRALPEVRFCAVSIFPTPKETAEIKYELPDNFHLEHIAYIHEYNLEPEGNKERRERRRVVDTIVDFHQHIGEGEGDRFGAVVDLFQHPGESGLTVRDLVHGKEAWSFLVEQYQGSQNTVSFIDYFWTYRFTPSASVQPAARTDSARQGVPYHLHGIRGHARRHGQAYLPAPHAAHGARHLHQGAQDRDRPG